MRIIAGRYKGRQLSTPKSNAIRPTSDRVRESLFNVLEHGLGLAFKDVRAIDLFAGTGALGLEALSRGASFCLFVEHSAESRALIRMNIEALGLTGSTRLYRRDAARLDSAGTMGRFQLAFLDPPYDKGLGMLALEGLKQGNWLTPGAICVVEERKSAKLALPSGFQLVDKRIHADTQLLFCRFEAVSAAETAFQYP